MALDLVGPFIRAIGYRRGRGGHKVWLLGIHTAEGATSAQALGEYFHTHSSGSSHGGVGQAGEYAQYVNYDDTAWTNPPLNQYADTLEICGFAAWPRAEWLKHSAMLDTVARWIAWRSAVRGIPIRRVTGKELASHTPGIAGHKDINDVFRSSSHWDPGPGFPWDIVLAKAIAIRYPKQSKPPLLGVINTPGSYRVVAGDTWYGLAKRAYPKVNPTTAWPRLAAYNNNVTLQPGKIVKMPPVSVVNPPKRSKPTTANPVPRFPLERGEFFGPKSGPDRSVSGYYSHRADFRTFQTRLNHLGYKVTADGLYGSQSAGAIRTFQRDRDLPVTGLVDAATWRAAWQV